MRILPVIDLLGGEVVHAVGGRRSEYRPIRSSLCKGSAPLSIARAFREHFGLEELYLADLEAIAGKERAGAVCAELLADGFRLWVDGGVRRREDANAIAAGSGLVLGLETLQGACSLAEIVREHGERVLLSLDLREGEPLVGSLDGWQRPTALGIVAEAVSLGVKRILVLDLARVGSGGGTGTEELCRALAASYPRVEILAGGGIRGREDLLRLKEGGVSAALVASALHDGRLTRRDLEGL
jgi:phosphoribosylformimino-5-aminoimidazole carboxamide ribotide isomerase